MTELYKGPTEIAKSALKNLINTRPNSHPAKALSDNILEVIEQVTERGGEFSIEILKNMLRLLIRQSEKLSNNITAGDDVLDRIVESVGGDRPGEIVRDILLDENHQLRQDPLGLISELKNCCEELLKELG